MTVDPAVALARLRVAAEDGTIDEISERRGVRLLAVFGSALRSSDAGDIDVAVSFMADPDVLGLIDDLTTLTGYERFDVAVIDGADPVIRARGLTGLGLYESEKGLFATEQMAALAEEWDTRWLRRLSLRALAR